MLDIEELKRLEAAASPGEWVFYPCAHDPEFNTFSFLEHDDEEGDDYPVPCLSSEQISEEECRANWDLLLFLRNAAPAIIAELQELRRLRPC
jgi:hypothetical protein